jgi:hypothetical protein
MALSEQQGRKLNQIAPPDRPGMCALSFDALELDIPGDEPRLKLTIIFDQVIVFATGDP